MSEWLSGRVHSFSCTQRPYSEEYIAYLVLRCTCCHNIVLFVHNWSNRPIKESDQSTRDTYICPHPPNPKPIVSSVVSYKQAGIHDLSSYTKIAATPSILTLIVIASPFVSSNVVGRTSNSNRRYTNNDRGDRRNSSRVFRRWQKKFRMSILRESGTFYQCMSFIHFCWK